MWRITFHSPASALLVAFAGCSMIAGGCGNDAGEAVVAAVTTTSSAPAPSTTVAPGVTITTGRVTTTVRTVLTEVVVDSGTAASGPWRLVAEPGGRAGLVCASLRGPFQFAGSVCNEASEQDFNGDDTIRYSSAGDGGFVIAVTRPAVARVRVTLRVGSTVERATVAAPFTTAARFVAVGLPAGAAIRSLTALDGNGRVLTTVAVNP